VPPVLSRFFHVADRGSSIRREVLGGITTFIAMAYIIVVNPAILHAAGIPRGPSTVATILTAAFGSLLMGLYANRPIAVAPYMGENAFIAFGLVALGATWEQRLGSVFVAGVVFLLLTVLQVRSKLANAISPSLKYSFAAGIGLFLAFIGLYETGIVTSGAAGLPPAALLNSLGPQLLSAPDVPVKIGAFQELHVLLAIAGFVVTVALMIRKVPGAILIGMGATAAAGYAIGLGPVPAPSDLFAMPFTGAFTLSPIALHLDISGVLTLGFLPVLLTLVLMSFLDTLGTLVGVGAAGNMLDKDGNFPEVEKPMLVDAVSCIFASLVGTSTSGAYIESATGIREGARTGLAAVVTGGLFLASLFLLPIVAPLQQSQYIYGPALVAVGMLMVGSVRKIDFDDLTEALPAFACIALMVFTYNIANGLTAGLVLYPIGKVVAGRARELNGGSVALALLCLTYFLFGLPH
jgi:AGZA family xanthine/uracil permease-like MFS transporter